MQESEIEITDIDENEKSWFKKIKDWAYENWQTVLVVLIVLIVGISAYNYNKQNNNAAPVTINNETNSKQENNNNKQNGEKENTQSQTDNEALTENKDQEKAAKEDVEKTNKLAVKDNVNENTNKNENSKEQVVSSSDNSEKVYTISAKYGEGITHLARHALERYLQKRKVEYNLTKEHKVYIEDYIQNRTGSQKIELGHKETFSESLIKEAISKAKNLSQKSLENLKKYTK